MLASRQQLAIVSPAGCSESETVRVQGVGESVGDSSFSASGSSDWQWHSDRVQRWRPDIASRGGEGGFPASGGGLPVWTRQHSSPGRGFWYPTYDANGNVCEMLAEDGSVAARWDYDAFGNSTHATPGTWPSVASQFTHRFATKPADPDTGLHHYGYRWLDPVTGRWTSRDPIEEEGGVNLYGFVANDGVSRTGYLDQECNKGRVKFARFCVGFRLGMVGGSRQICTDIVFDVLIDIVVDDLKKEIKNKNNNKVLGEFLVAVERNVGVLNAIGAIVDGAVFKGDFGVNMSVDYSCCECDDGGGEEVWEWGQRRRAFTWLDDDSSGMTYPIGLRNIRGHHEFVIDDLASEIKQECGLMVD